MLSDNKKSIGSCMNCLSFTYLPRAYWKRLRACQNIARKPFIITQPVCCGVIMTVNSYLLRQQLWFTS